MKKTVRIALGADHRGYHHKAYIMKNLVVDEYAIQWIDVGAYNDIRSDYPEYAIAACEQLLHYNADCAILLCGTGVGMAIAANRFPTIYAAVAWNQEIARLCKEDENANVLVIPADFVTCQDTVLCIDVWLRAAFKHDRYEKRIAMINSIS